jgi:hypothetical protein
VLIVENLHTTAHVFRKMLFLAVMGFAVVVLFGPIVAVLSVVLSFALIGFLVWLPFQVLVLGRTVDWRAVGQRAQMVGQEAGQAARKSLGWLAAPVRLLSWVVGGFLAAIWFTIRTVLAATGLLLQAIITAATGAAIGCLWTMLTLGHGQELVPATLGNALVGAAITTLAWGAMTILERRQWTRQPVRSVV